MLSFSKTVLSAAIVGAAIARAQVLPVVADVNLGNSPVCPVPGPGVDAGVLAVVQFDETASLTAVGGALLEADVSVNVCLCVDANVNTGIPLSASLQADARAAITAYVRTSTSTLLAPLRGALGLLGPNGLVNIDVVPGEVVGTCLCPATQRPTCEDGQCGCEDCPAQQVYDPSLNACAPCPTGSVFDDDAQNCVVVDPVPGPSQAVRRNRRSNPAIDRRQTNRESVMQRLRR